MKNGNVQTKRLFMEVNGIVKELDMTRLSAAVVDALEKEYAKSKVVGISRKLYNYMTEYLADQTADYLLAINEANSEAAKAKIFASRFGVKCNESPCLLASLCWVETMVDIDPEFSSKDISIRSVRNYLSQLLGHCSYGRMSKEFKEWDENPFKYTDMMVGFVRFLKYFYSLIKLDMQPVLAAC